MRQIIECVPNFSEGRDKSVIDKIVLAIASAKAGEEGVKVLDVDQGEATNRTVVTFVGTPEAVLEAAFQGVVKANELIDMRKHHGAHPRSGACDVLPLVPVAGITLQECAQLARSLAKRIYEELELGIVKESTLKEFVDIINKMKEEQGIEAVILGCTELPLLLNSENTPVPCLDSVEIHIRKLIELAMK